MPSWGVQFIFLYFFSLEAVNNIKMTENVDKFSRFFVFLLINELFNLEVIIMYLFIKLPAHNIDVFQWKKVSESILFLIIGICLEEKLQGRQLIMSRDCGTENSVSSIALFSVVNQLNQLSIIVIYSVYISCSLNVIYSLDFAFFHLIFEFANTINSLFYD